MTHDAQRSPSIRELDDVARSRTDRVVIHLVSLASVVPQPWRNGGGSTQVLLTWPHADDWMLRISVARIERNGPFSAFPGVERWFAVMQGDGVTLRLGDTNIDLRPDSAPFRFDGVAAPECFLLNDATQDLNLMVMRESGVGVMTRVLDGESSLAAAPFRAVYTTGSSTLRLDDSRGTRLSPDTLAWSDDAGDQRWTLAADRNGASLRAWSLEFTPHTARADRTERDYDDARDEQSI